MKKVLLLDFDGVVLKNKVADSKVAKRAGIYTWKSINNIRSKQDFISITQAEDICYNLYKGYGHTLCGLKDMGLDVNLKDYNDMIYKTIDYKVVRKTNNDMNDVRNLIQFCKNKRIEMFMFSNSPMAWMENTLENDTDIVHDIPDVRDILKISENDDLFLKPQSYIYDAIEKRFQDTKCIFVDDNISNFRYVMHNSCWKKIVCSTVNKKINNDMFIVDAIKGVLDVL